MNLCNNILKNDTNDLMGFYLVYEYSLSNFTLT
jgi:hypothetical protein